VTCKGQNSLLRAFGTGKQWEKAVTSLSMVTDISSNAILSACEKPLGIKDELMTHHLVRIIGTIGCEDLHRGNYESFDICIMHLYDRFLLFAIPDPGSPVYILLAVF